MPEAEQAAGRYEQVERLARACCRIHNIDPDAATPEGGLYEFNHYGGHAVPAWYHFREHALNFMAMHAETFAGNGVTEPSEGASSQT